MFFTFSYGQESTIHVKTKKGKLWNLILKLLINTNIFVVISFLNW